MKKLILGVFVLSLFSCAQQESKQTSTPKYFDINGYFLNEADRLHQLNPTIIKSVIAIGKAESHSIKITDWKTELAGFSNADINKASWQGEFTKVVKGGNISYATTNPKIPIKKVEITKTGNQVKCVKIIKANKNILYASSDTLLYYPDSLYIIRSEQKIKLLSSKKYQVIGKLK